MGLIKAIAGATGGVLADQWKEYIYCEAMSADVLVTKGKKRTSRRSSNKKGEENIITNGSVVAVNEGQCMIIVDQGKVADVCAEPGEYVYDSSSEPSVFYGGFGKGILDTFKAIGRRFTFGGDTGKDQRVYFLNTKEISGNKYGTASPIPFRVVDTNIGLDMDIEIRCHGEYSYVISDPILFYTNVCANVSGDFLRYQLDSQLKSELMTALQPAFAKISAMGIRYSALPGHTMELADALNEVLSKKWSELRGIRVFSFGVNSVTAPEEDERMIKELQRNAVYRDPRMAGATLVGAQAQAMQDAAKNTSAGPVMGFAAMNMAQGVGGMNAQGFYAMGNTTPNPAPAANTWKCACGAENTGKFCSGCGAKKPEAAASWKCSCGYDNVGKFCQNCGAKKPDDHKIGWTCACGAVNSGKFCAECGAKKPEGALNYRCDKCGWEPDDPTKPPKFCPECGDLFDDSDVT